MLYKTLILYNILLLYTKITEILEEKKHCIINKLNSLELNKLNRYIIVQEKILNHHKKNQNFDAYSVVSGSIELMLKFKEQYNF